MKQTQSFKYRLLDTRCAICYERNDKPTFKMVTARDITPWELMWLICEEV